MISKTLTDAAKVFQGTELYRDLESNYLTRAKVLLAELVEAGLSSADQLVLSLAVAIRTDAQFWRRLTDVVKGSATPLEDVTPGKGPEKLFRDFELPEAIAVGEGMYTP